MRFAIVWGLGTMLSAAAIANDADVVDVEFKYVRGGVWQVSVLINHTHTSWTDFADRWRVVSQDGVVLGEKFMNPEKISLGDFDKTSMTVEIPPQEEAVIVEAHDSVKGWSPKRVVVELRRNEGPHYRVRR